ncbi:glutathione S-transferase T3-like [Raphanus sativus]|uniref:Glutathione S-transferase T3-like n=1 Tax=Raphanus sativus TaxID=3726 RepID=A0A6J0LSX3_RAPSA|nr:glutathione S-transferase T3-like [Raphanus sativus]
MDRRNVHAQSSSYVGLLYSQQGSVAREDFPYENTPVPTPVPTPVDRVVRRKWTPADDEVLISGWLNTSKDAIVGNDQKSQTFWQRVADYYAASPHGGEDGEKRTHHCVKKRWHRINDQVNKFCGAFSAADRQISSGESDTDVLKKAHDIFYSDHNSRFNLEHAWCLLRYEQKWLCLNTPKPTPKWKTGETSTETPTTEVPDHLIRPEGIKAAKARRNTAQGKSVADYKSIWK